MSQSPLCKQIITNIGRSGRESFDNIYLDLSKESGKCRFAETGFGWKPSGGGETFTVDSSTIGGAQWSRASKGYEVKVLLRNSGVVQLDGFSQEVSDWISVLLEQGLRLKSEDVLWTRADESQTGF
jgi:hypothetical protein